MSNSKKLTAFLISAISVICIDQYTKFLALKNLSRGVPVKVLGNYFGFYLTKNPGGVFGTKIGSNTIYIIFSILGLFIILFYVWQLFKKNNKFGIIGSGLLFGGALGNMIDRFRFSEVTDFIDMGINNLRWAKYNIADVAILAGLVVLVIIELKDVRKDRPSYGETSGDTGSDDDRGANETGSLPGAGGDSAVALSDTTIDSGQADKSNG